MCDNNGIKRTEKQIENLKKSLNRPETKQKRRENNLGERNPRYGVKEDPKKKKIRLKKVSDFYSSKEGFITQGNKTRGKTWYHLPDGTERRFDENPGAPWEKGRNESFGHVVKHNLDHSLGGKTAGKLPWWYNPITGERRRSTESPGEGWEARKGPNRIKG